MSPGIYPFSCRKTVQMAQHREEFNFSKEPRVSPSPQAASRKGGWPQRAQPDTRTQFWKVSPSSKNKIPGKLCIMQLS